MITLHAEVRETNGKGASRRLRHANKLPAIVYGGKEAPVSIELNHDAVANLQDKDAFYQEDITLVVNGKETKVKIQDIQRHPFKPKVTHIDFKRA